MKVIYCLICLVSMNVTTYAYDNIRIVGSSTVYPFVSTVSEQFSNKTHLPAPIVESTGTGGGFKMFCESNTSQAPDMVNASRPIKDSERALCKAKGITNIIEIIFGYDAIVIINNKTLPPLNLTREQIFLALAKEIPDSNGNLITNPYKKWIQIDSHLPNIPIKVMGPPSTSGTRDSFMAMVMEQACHTLQATGKMKKLSNNEARVCHTVRSDGAWIDGGENDMLLVKKVAQGQDIFAILGYSFYLQNQKIINAIAINGIIPNKKNLQKRAYPLFRPLFVYVKEDNIGVVKGLSEFLKELTSAHALGDKGYLQARGLIPLSLQEYKNLVAKLKLSHK